ncbi:MAG: putative outer membrane repeat protein [Urechidicola sp.]|jgi:predicted outer membrane repeat protein
MNPSWEMTFQTDILTTNVSVQLGLDTLSCGQTWTPIYQIDNNGFFDEQIGFFREEGAKVFIRKTLECSEDEYLMYDFSAEVGDTLWCGFDLNIPQYSPVPIVVGATQTEIFNGISRRIIFATYKPDPFALPIQFQWVEGVGDLVHPFYSLNCYPYLCGELEYSFHCMYVEGNLAFSNPFSFQSCEYLIDTLHVNQNLLNGNNDGTNWENAFFDLQDALTIADSSTVILVAQGTYFPTNGDDRTQSFTVSDGVQLYGGFLGNEINISDRNIIENPTILSGDIGNTEDKSDNSYHVLYAIGVDSTTIIDGFFIENGNANFSPLSNINARGGGLLINSDTQNPKANPIIQNCIFTNNYAGFGGGIYCKSIMDNPSLQFLENCVFENNIADRNGGGLYKEGGGENHKTIFNNCLFTKKSSIRGGGIYFGDISGSYEIKNCTFFKDSSGFEGGGLLITPSTIPLELKFINSNFIENKSGSGGGFSIVYTGLNPNPSDSLICYIDSCVFDKNIAVSNAGGGIYIGNSGIKDNFFINRTTFSNNISFNLGGGISYENSESGDNSTTLQKCTFNNNSSINFSYGGGLFYKGQGNGSSPITNKTQIYNCQFYENNGAIGFFNGSLGTVDAFLANCTFYNNQDIPIIKNWSSNFDSINFYNNITISNSIIWEETPIELLFSNGNFTNSTIHNYFINNCLINAPNCIVDGVNACAEGMIYEQSPLFKDVLLKDFSLRSCSPAINAGSNLFLNTNFTVDLNGNTRILEDIVDMGAFERNSWSNEVINTIEESCNEALDGEILITTEGDAPFNYEWEMGNNSGQGLTNLGAGVYEISVTDASNCTDTLTIEIGQIPEMNSFATIQNATTFISENGSIFIDSIIGGTPPYILEWNNEDTTYLLDNLFADTYSLTVTDSNECQIDTNFVVSAINPVTELSFENTITLFPNPIVNQESIQINFDTQYENVWIINLFSLERKYLTSQKFFIQKKDTIEFNISDLPIGGYYFQFINENQEVFYRKVIISN